MAEQLVGMKRNTHRECKKVSARNQQPCPETEQG